MKILVVVPAYNEARSIVSVIKDLFRFGFGDILVVDDGSIDGTDQLAKKEKVKVLRHVLNRGLGAALGTGITYAKKGGYDVLITFDSDGQHQASDLKKLIEPIIKNKADVVIGSRLLKRSKNMPLDRLIISYLGNILTLVLYRFRSTDSQSGLRAFNKKALNCITIKTDQMEVSSDFLREIKKNKLRYKEVPIEPIYTEYSRQSGQTNLNSFNVALKMFLRLFR